MSTSVGASDAGLADGCYRYTLTGTDRVGNTASVQSAIVIVDKTAPSICVISSLLADGSYKAGQVCADYRDFQ